MIRAAGYPAMNPQTPSSPRLGEAIQGPRSPPTQGPTAALRSHHGRALPLRLGTQVQTSLSTGPAERREYGASGSATCALGSSVSRRGPRLAQESLPQAIGCSTTTCSILCSAGVAMLPGKRSWHYSARVRASLGGSQKERGAWPRPRGVLAGAGVHWKEEGENQRTGRSARLNNSHGDPTSHVD